MHTAPPQYLGTYQNSKTISAPAYLTPRPCAVDGAVMGRGYLRIDQHHAGRCHTISVAVDGCDPHSPNLRFGRLRYERVRSDSVRRLLLCALILCPYSSPQLSRTATNLGPSSAPTLCNVQFRFTRPRPTASSQFPVQFSNEKSSCERIGKQANAHKAAFSENHGQPLR